MTGLTVSWIGFVLLAVAGQLEPGAASGLPDAATAYGGVAPGLPLCPVAYDAPAVEPSALAERLADLEAETAALRGQLERLQAPPALPPPPPPALPAEQKMLTLDELKGEMKKLAWTKGDFTVTPYGTLWATMTYETARTNSGDYVLWVYPENVEGEDAFHIDAKSTRLGFDVAGPRIPWFDCAATGGKVEVDFQRQLDTENRPGVLLRHAYLEVKNEELRLLAGQTWDVMSPLYPGTLMYTVGWGGGNIGYRRAQFRGERFLALSDGALLVVQGALASDIVTDTAVGVTGDHAAWPVLEARLGVVLGPRGKDCRPLEFGVSGHMGEQVFDFREPTWVVDPVEDLSRRTWSFNVDLKAPLTRRLGVQAEFFTGENLGAFYGGVIQGIDIGTPAMPGTRRSIRSTGGWVDVWYDWTDRLHTHVGYSIDDPFDEDVTGVRGNTGFGRTYNHFVFANVSFDVTKKFLVGVETTLWKTLWKANDPGESVNNAVVAKYSF